MDHAAGAQAAAGLALGVCCTRDCGGLERLEAICRDTELSRHVKVRTPEWVHPAWRLARKVPADGVPIASKDVSPAISSFAESYTYDGSLPSKAKMEGLAIGTHMIVDTRLKVVQQWGMAMKGAKVVARDDPFVLISWSAGSLDTKWSRMRDARMTRPPPYSGPYQNPSRIPGVPPKVGGQKIDGIVPRLRLPWMK